MLIPIGLLAYLRFEGGTAVGGRGDMVGARPTKPNRAGTESTLPTAPIRTAQLLCMNLRGFQMV